MPQQVSPLHSSKQTTEKGENTSNETRKESPLLFFFLTRTVGVEGARVGLANAGIGADQEGRHAVGGRQGVRAARVEDSIQERRNGRHIGVGDTQGTRRRSDLGDEVVVFRLVNVHEAMDGHHIGISSVGWKSGRRATNQCAEELIQVRQQHILIGTTVQEVNGHRIAAAICGRTSAANIGAKPAEGARIPGTLRLLLPRTARFTTASMRFN